MNEQDTDLNNGVQIILNRMKTNPEEFFDPKKENEWSFIYNETFRDILTEPEKAAIHTALKAVRRKEFESKIMKTILKADANAQYEMPTSFQPNKMLISTGSGVAWR